MAFQDLNGHFDLMQNISEIDNLIKLIAKLPGLGPKSAKRIVLKLKPHLAPIKAAVIPLKKNKE